MIKFEILLPLFYNDGRPVEREKFIETKRYKEIFQKGAHGAPLPPPSAAAALRLVP